MPEYGYLGCASAGQGERPADPQACTLGGGTYMLRYAGDELTFYKVNSPPA